MKIDFAAVKLIPIVSVLDFYHVPVRKRNNTEYVCDCPLPSHKEAKHQKGTFAISSAKGKWFCHADTCRATGNHPKGGDAIDLVSRLDNTTPLEAAKKLSELFCLPGKGEGERRNELSTPSAAASAPESNKPLAFELRGIQHEHPFIQERGITVATATTFNVGYFPGKGSMASRVVFPLYEDGHLIGYAGRTVLEPSDDNPKWKLPSGLVKSFLYGLEKCDPAKPLILCESPWAVLWFFQHDRQAAALLGKTMSIEQERRLTPYQEITIAMDNDAAGRNASGKLAERLKPGRKIITAYLID